MPMIIKLAVYLLRSTNGSTVDLDKYSQSKTLTSSMRTLKSCNSITSKTEIVTNPNSDETLLEWITHSS
jgi:hypothetical protein